LLTKKGFFSVTATLNINSAKEWALSIELKEEEVEDEVTVYATRNDVRIQDSVVRVEVLQREEIEEKCS